MTNSTRNTSTTSDIHSVWKENVPIIRHTGQCPVFSKLYIEFTEYHFHFKAVTKSSWVTNLEPRILMVARLHISRPTIWKPRCSPHILPKVSARSICQRS